MGADTATSPEGALRDQHELAIMRGLIRQSPVCIAMFDRDVVYLAASTHWADLYTSGVDPTGQSHYALLPDLPDHWKQVHQRALGGEIVSKEEDLWLRADGSRMWLRWSVHPWRDDSDQIGGIIIIAEDMTRRIETEEALKDSEQQYRALVELSPDAVVVHRDQRLVFVNAAAITLFGANTAADLVGRSLWDVIDPSFQEVVARRTATLLSGGSVPAILVSIRTLGGEIRTAEARAAALRDRHGLAVQVVLRDVTEQQRAARAIEEGEARLSAVLRSAMDGIITVGDDQIILLANPAAEKMFGYPQGHLVGRSLDLLIPSSVRAGHADLVRSFGRTGITHRRMGNLGAIEGVRANGERFPIEASISQIEIGGRRLYTVIHRDVSERARAESILAAEQERFRQLAESIREVFWLTDASKSRLLYISPAYETIWGRSCDSVYEAPERWLETIHPDDRERISRVRAEEPFLKYDERYRILRPDGSIRWIHDRGFPVRDGSGLLVRIAGVAEDITERQRLEEQLRQTQKMESIGQLAGGVAHDFNNLLTVIVSSAEMLSNGETEHPRRELVEDILDAGRRGASLTRQLLAFSRREVIEPRVMDLADVIGDTEKLLRRLIGEDIALEVHMKGPCPVRIDPGQWSQVLLNLAVNARDAMPGGGKLTIESYPLKLGEGGERPNVSLPRGDCAALIVSDTGCGMSEEIQARIFEPFFTTKGRRKGTGLGLAVVYGAVHQSGGAIEVRSAPGEGSRFAIYLPMTGAPPSEQRPLASADLSGRETVLLVEDEPVVQRVAAKILRSRGYTVLAASDGRDALRLLQERASRVDLLLTDVVMPNMAGPELAEVLRARWPSIKVLYTSGYMDDEVAERIGTLAKATFLQKPYTSAILLRRVREVLDGAPVSP